MPSIQFKGKNIVWNHHQSPLLPVHTLDKNKIMSFQTKGKAISETLFDKQSEQSATEVKPNILVEGDNLLALKALMPEYSGKVKCIYIDPPYNTGNEGWVYNDNVNSPMIQEWIGETVGKESEDFTRHDKWLCMMTPRLKLLHQLLADDGVIFVSIDDNEVANLRLLMNEIWGEENFVGELVWKRRASSAMSDNGLSTDHEYVICFKKNSNILFKGEGKLYDSYSNQDNDQRGDWVTGDLTVGMTASQRPNQNYDLVDPITGNSFAPNPNRVWAYIPESMNKLISENRVIFPADKSKRPMLKRFKNELKSDSNPFSSWMVNIGLNTESTRQIQDMFGSKVFDYAKPLSLVKSLITQSTDKNSVILDSFAGSGTTGQAVMELNHEDGGNRQFILVQMPEPLSPDSPAGKYCTDNNLPLKVSSITRERIRLATEKKELGDITLDYYDLGTPLDAWAIISSESDEQLPPFGKLAGYIWKNLTGETKELKTSKKDDIHKYILGEYKGQVVVLLYEQSLTKLQGKDLALSLNIAKELEEIYPNTPKLVYAVVNYLDQWHSEKYQISYVNYPFGM